MTCPFCGGCGYYIEAIAGKYQSRRECKYCAAIKAFPEKAQILLAQAKVIADEFSKMAEVDVATLLQAVKNADIPSPTSQTQSSVFDDLFLRSIGIQWP